MTPYEFMENSWYTFLGMLCWGGILMVAIFVIAFVVWLVNRDEKGDTRDE